MGKIGWWAWLAAMTLLFIVFMTNTAAANGARYACVVLAAGAAWFLWQTRGRRREQRWLAAGMTVSLVTDAVLLFAPTSRWVPLAVGLFAAVHWCYLHRFGPVWPAAALAAGTALLSGALGWLLPAAGLYAGLLLTDAVVTWRGELPSVQATWLARAGVTAFVLCDVVVALGAVGRSDPGWSWLFYWPALVLFVASAR
ncbi:lysoplasmalogenase family protein [Schleiferilactobacillus shenzhenensis]|uniref:YhhN n=1 Tax=Schleiferilactobacillus shenzhenensis LY-73 TaxID=1231336 RepID=U4TNK3_9LACO|nr:lysoplasmalogenase family protein [Schleiferilactobacillus shenzhenensis]ERL65010.1 hypothetical protein L248_3172 [Schleiferilactobacillus shenzhenensis LY-73]